jgi:hypothetical protein
MPKKRECKQRKTQEDKLSLKNNKQRLLDNCCNNSSERKLCKPPLMMQVSPKKKENLPKKNWQPLFKKKKELLKSRESEMKREKLSKRSKDN